MTKEKELKQAIKSAKLIRKQANADVQSAEENLDNYYREKLEAGVKDGFFEKRPNRWNSKKEDFFNKYIEIHVAGGQVRASINSDNFSWEDIKKLNWQTLQYCCLSTFTNRAKKLNDTVMVDIGMRAQSYLL